MMKTDRAAGIGRWLAHRQQMLSANGRPAASLLAFGVSSGIAHPDSIASAAIVS